MPAAPPPLDALIGLPEGDASAGEQPQRLIAQVAVDVALPHLDRPFDYLVPEALHDEVRVGCRVRVRFAGRLCDGFVVGLVDHSEAERLQPLQRVTSSEVVLTAAVARLVRAVADHCAGTFADVARLAVPPRHAATERAPRRSTPGDAASLPGATGPAEGTGPGAQAPWHAYPTGPGLLAALAGGRSPRAAWQVAPVSGPLGDWARGLAAAAAASRASGRGAVLVVPDGRDVDRLAEACAELLGPDAFVVLTAELGPAERYRAFLAVVRGEVQVVVGTRAAAFAPVHDLGLVALWDDGNDVLAEPRAPYPHARDVLAIRSHLEEAAVLYAGYARSAEVQAWQEQGWLRSVELERAVARRAEPRVRASGDDERAEDRDAAARSARLPHDVFTVIRSGLAAGPVLVQVPRSGYLARLVCATCREPVRCPVCHGPVRVRRVGADLRVECGWCGRALEDWRCPTRWDDGPCGSTRWRSPVVGSVRTAEELERAFPRTRVLRSWGPESGRGTASILPRVGSDPALVVATPGAEPPADGGYAAAVLLDGRILLARADLRAEEEALRRWLAATALVRGGEDGGTVIVVAPPQARAVQGLVRLDPVGFAARELADRAEAHFPPAARFVVLDGPPEAVDELAAAVQGQSGLGPPGLETLGPVEAPPAADGSARARLTLRCPLAYGSALTRAVHEAAAARSARKAPGAVRIRVDPVAIG